MKKPLMTGRVPPKGYPLSRRNYVDRIHEGGSGGYGIATHDVLIYHDEALRLEITRLREALEKIRGIKDLCGCATRAYPCVHDIARAALAEGKP